MPAVIINLNKQRKLTQRQKKEKLAHQNRAKFGRTKNQKKKQASEEKKSSELLSGKKLSPDN